MSRENARGNRFGESVKGWVSDYLFSSIVYEWAAERFSLPLCSWRGNARRRGRSGVPMNKMIANSRRISRDAMMFNARYISTKAKHRGKRKKQKTLQRHRGETLARAISSGKIRVAMVARSFPDRPPRYIWPLVQIWTCGNRSSTRRNLESRFGSPVKILRGSNFKKSCNFSFF